VLGTLTSETTVAQLRSATTAERDRAWSTVYEEHFDRIYRLAYRYGVPSAEVEDVAQRVFLIAHRRIHEVQELTSVGAWLKGIAVRVIADHRRWRRVRTLKAWIVRSEEQRLASARERCPEASAVAAQAQELAARIFDRMSPKLRDVLVLVDVEGSSADECAEILRIPVNTVRSRLRLARAEFDRLRKQRLFLKDGAP